jgi:predicted amidohydrolase YtcJ
MLIEHSRIYLDATGRTTDALLVREGRVVATGARARSLRTDGEQVVEPPGACLFPALADAHCHLWGVGLRAGSVDLSDTASVAEVYERLGAHDPSRSPSGWVLGYGWDEHDWPAGQQLHLAELDRLFPDTPVCVHRVDRHAVAVNCAALRRAGLDNAYAPPAGGKAVRDAAGELTGVLVDAAMAPVLEAVPPATQAEDRRIFERTAAQYLSYGITSAHMALCEVARVDMLREMAAVQALPVRVYTIVDGQDPDLDRVLAEGPHHDADAWLSVAAIKLFADGALGSKGALLLEPYDDGSRGLAMIEAGELRRRVAAHADSGWQVAVHAIGDAGARRVIEAFAGVPEETRDELRLRLEHAQMLTDADCRRLGELSAIASIQPIHLRSDGAWAHTILSEAQLDRLYPWPALAAHCPLAAGSDFPIEDPNPWHGIATALTRRTEAGEAFFGDKALGREQILAAYTTGAAYAAHWEGVLGRLDDGYVADVIALGCDPFDATPEALWEMEVLGAWVGGQRRF